MFVDGVTYAVLARNLAQKSFYNFWSLYYLDLFEPDFFEHPPLGLWIQSLYFRCLGDHWFTERLFVFTTALSLFASMALLWRRVFGHLPCGVWWPLSLLASMPLTGWVYANNLLEAPLTVFCVLSVLSLEMAWREELRLPRAAVWSGVSAGFAVAATLVKGPQGLFIMAAPLCLKIRTGGNRKLFGTCLVSYAFTICGFCCFVFFHRVAFDFVSRYAYQQIWSGVTGQREHVAFRGYILWRLLSELALPTFLGGLVIYLFPTRRLQDATKDNVSSYFLLIFLGCSMPVVFSAKQSGWYIYASLPFFIMALAGKTAEYAGNIEERFTNKNNRRRMVCFLTLSVFCLGLFIATQWRTVRRDQDLFASSDAWVQLLQPQTEVGVCPSDVAQNWVLVAHMARIFQVRVVDLSTLPFVLTDARRPCLLTQKLWPVHGIGTRYILWENPHESIAKR